MASTSQCKYCGSTITSLDKCCPNCGAPITGEKCEYCGTVIYDFSVIDINKPSYIKMRFNDRLFIFCAILKNATMTTENSNERYFCDDQPIFSIPRISMSISAEFDVVERNGVLVTERRADENC